MLGMRGDVLGVVVGWLGTDMTQKDRSFMMLAAAAAATARPSLGRLLAVTMKASKAHSSASASASKRCLVPIATGSEEMEAVVAIDVLRRAGADVVVAAAQGELLVTCSRGTKIQADMLVEDALKAHGPFDAIVVPGGMPGASNLAACAPLVDALKAQRAEGKLIGAICAAPAVVLEAHGILAAETSATAHPAFLDKLGAKKVEDFVVCNDAKNLVTSRGPGTALIFALKLVEVLYGADHADKVAKPMVLPHSRQ